MDKITLYNQNGQKFDVDVIRYFKNSENKYLIFGLNEIDNNGYIQLYVSKAADLDGQLVLISITNDDEWKAFTNSLQKIVTNNRNNIPNNVDLDFSILNNMKVSSFRIIKIKDEVSKILSANKNNQDDEVKLKVIEEPFEETSKKIKEPTNLLDASAQDTGMSIEEILKKVSDGAKSAREEEKKEKSKKTIDDLLKSAKIEKEDEYKKKYEELLNKVNRLENENIHLINELIEVKAKLETIKDIIE